MWAWIELFLFGYFLFVVTYSLLFSIGGLFYRNPPQGLNKKKFKIAVLIPCYKEDNIIVGIASQALVQSYPKEYYDVIIIADSLQQETLLRLRNLDVIVHEVQFEKSTKAKSLKSALNTFDGYEIAVVLDADNVMENQFLERINTCFNDGAKAIQSQRTAKNRNTSFAILDGISEAIANHINRQAPSAFGLSSSLIGSGMAFDYNLFRTINNSIDQTSVAEDKELQIAILRKGIKIHYLKSAIVYDEKVDNRQVFESQRKRWMYSHYAYLKKFFFLGIASLFNGNFSIFNITILFNIQLPRIMNLGLLSIISLVSLVAHHYVILPFWYWPCLLALYLMSFAIAIPKSYYNKSLFQAILTAPKAFISIFSIHFKLKDVSKKFINTPHKEF